MGDEQSDETGGRGWADEILTPLRVGVLGALSVIASGLIIWAGAGGSASSDAASALSRARVVVYVPAVADAADPAGAGLPADPRTDRAPLAITANGKTISKPGSTPTSGGPAASGGSGSGGGAATPGATGRQGTAGAPQTTAAVGSTGTTGRAGTTGATGSAGPAATPATGASKIKHVFVITLASPGYDATWGSGSVDRYLSTQLRPRGTLLSSYYGIGHPDLPNYIAMISGQAPNADTETDCQTFSLFPATSKLDSSGQLSGAGCVYPLTVLTVADQLTAAGLKWRAYAEDLANGSPPVKTCRHPNTGQPDDTQVARPGDAYAARHNPFVYFDSLLELGDCASDDVPLSQLKTDLGSVATTANFSFIAPNLCHDGSESPCLDGEPGGLVSADAFLQQWVPPILASPAYRKDGLLVITFADGPSSDTSGCCQGKPASGATGTPTGGGRIGALLLSPFVKPGATSATPYNHYSLLRTVEDIFGLGHLAGAGGPGVSSISGSFLDDATPVAEGAARHD